MKTRIALSTMLIVVLLSSLFVPFVGAQGPATDDVGQAPVPEGPASLTEWVLSGAPSFEAQPQAPGVARPAPEALSFYTDRPTFDGDFPGLPIEGYEAANVNPTDILGFGMPLDEFTDNGIFSPGDILPGISFWASGGDPGSELVILGGASGFGETSKTVLANFFVEYYIIRFDPPVQAAGMDLQTLLGTYSCNLDIYGAGGLLGSTTSACNEPGVFWGVASDADPITEIHILDPGGGAEGADNVAFGGGGGMDEPDIRVDPEELVETLCVDEIKTVTLSICNDGTLPLEWSLSEVVPGRILDVLYDNGPLVTNPGGGFGGADLSTLQTNLGLNTYGFGNQFFYTYRMADDFEADAEWTVDQITFFAYQTGSPTDPSPINGLYFQIWDGVPDDPGSSIVFGDLVTNRLDNTTWSGIYRAVDYDPLASNRPIMANTGAAGVVLPAGTYWLDWLTDGTLSSGPWAPPISILGEITTGNAMQNTGAWAPALDTGTSTQQGMPFIIEGTAGGGGDDIPWLSESPTEGTVGPGDCQQVDVTFDATGLAPDVYSGELLIESNDPDTPELTVPVEMTVEECGEDTMHVEAINGWFHMDPMGTPFLRMMVLAADQAAAPLSDVLVEATISVPGRDDAPRMRYTRPNGWARFWAPALWSGNYQICVDNMTLEGYVFVPGPNDCMDWDKP